MVARYSARLDLRDLTVWCHQRTQEAARRRRPLRANAPIKLTPNRAHVAGSGTAVVTSTSETASNPGYAERPFVLYESKIRYGREAASEGAMNVNERASHEFTPVVGARAPNSVEPPIVPLERKI